MFAMATGEDEFPKCPLCQSAIPVGDGTFPFDLWIGARPKSQLKRNSTNPIAFRSYGIGSTTGNLLATILIVEDEFLPRAMLSDHLQENVSLIGGSSATYRVSV